MAKYHISRFTGEVSACSATLRACPLGGTHYDSETEARAAYEAVMGSGLESHEKQDTREAEALISEYRSLLPLRTEESYARIGELQKLIPTVLPDPPTARAMMDSISTPEGFTREERMTDIGYAGQENMVPQLLLRSHDVRITINFSDVRKEAYMLADGHVSFLTDKGWRTFDQRGIDDSFYIDNPLKNFSLDSPTRETNQTIQEFIEVKIPEARARIDGSVAVPGLKGRLISDAQKLEMAMKGSVSLYPSGFGIGYHFSTEPVAPLGSKPASEEQKRFFGVKNLWVSEFDCD